MLLLASRFPLRSVIQVTQCSARIQLPLRSLSNLTKSDRKFLQREIKKWNSSLPISSAFTPPSSWYIDPRFLVLEKEKIFKKNWIYAGRVDELPSVGSFVCRSFLGEPYILMKDNNNNINAFYNVCRHHGSTLCKGSGKQDSVVCPYHGWTYGLDGRLIRATEISGIKNFKAKDYGLKKIVVDQFGGWLFVYLGGDPPHSLHSQISPLEERLKKTDFEKLHFVRSDTYTVESNWKVYVDNYCDGGYHITHLHQSLNKQINYSDYKTEIFPHFSIQSVSGATEGTEMFYRDRVGKAGAFYAYVYPNFIVNRYGNWLDLNYIVPLSETRTLVEFHYYYQEQPNEINRDIIEKNIQESDRIQKEDETISQRVQEGMSSSSFKCGRYVPREQADYHFHQLLFKSYNS